MQSRHRRVLGELNLSVEAMLMPTIADQANGDADDVANASGNTDEMLLLGHTDDRLLSSPMGGCPNDLDSGFSGSSSASYRCVYLIGSLFLKEGQC